MIIEKIGSNKFAYKFLTDLELSIINQYFGSDIAHYFAFTSF